MRCGSIRLPGGNRCNRKLPRAPILSNAQVRCIPISIVTKPIYFGPGARLRAKVRSVARLERRQNEKPRSIRRAFDRVNARRREFRRNISRPLCPRRYIYNARRNFLFLFRAHTMGIGRNSRDFDGNSRAKQWPFVRELLSNKVVMSRRYVKRERWGLRDFFSSETRLPLCEKYSSWQRQVREKYLNKMENALRDALRDTKCS